MSYTKNAYLDLSEELGLAPAQLQRKLAEEDKDWQEHVNTHNVTPRRYCPFCNQNADEVEVAEVEEYA